MAAVDPAPDAHAGPPREGLQSSLRRTERVVLLLDTCCYSYAPPAPGHLSPQCATLSGRPTLAGDKFPRGCCGSSGRTHPKDKASEHLTGSRFKVNKLGVGMGRVECTATGARSRPASPPHSLRLSSGHRDIRLLRRGGQTCRRSSQPVLEGKGETWGGRVHLGIVR